MCWRSLQCARQWCLFVCLPSGAKLTLGALQAREQTELCEHWPTVPSSQTANLHSCANRKPQRWGVGSWRGRGAFSRPPALSSLPIRTSIGRWGAVVRWWSPNQKLFFSNILLAPKLNWKKKITLGNPASLLHGFVLIKPVRSLEPPINMSIACHKLPVVTQEALEVWTGVWSEPL